MEVTLIEGSFMDVYTIYTEINDIEFKSRDYYTVQEVKEKGFKIMRIKDR